MVIRGNPFQGAKIGSGGAGGQEHLLGRRGGRDDINNPALRVFSMLGLTVVVSGFALWLATLPRLRGRKGCDVSAPRWTPL